MTTLSPVRQTPPRMILTLGRRLLETGRSRIIRMLGLNAVAGFAEGVGVLALVPLLGLMGVGADSGPPDQWRLAAALAGYVGLVAAAAWVAQQRNLALQTFSLNFLDQLRSELHAAILAMEWARFRSLRTAEFQQTITGEVGRISFAVTLLGQLAGMALTLPFVLGAALLLSWPMTVAALAVAGLVALMTRRLGAESFRLGQKLGEASRAATADLADDLAGLRIIKSFGVEAERSAGIAARFAAIRRNQLTHHKNQAREGMALRIAAALAAAGALYLAVTALRVPMADALVLILAYGRLLQTALRGLGSWRQLTGAVAALESYDTAMARCRAAAEPAAPAHITIQAPRRAIRLCGVSLSHGDGDAARAALDNITADLPAGAITAVIGPSGAGKTTLADLAAGLTAPDTGEILIDDAPLTTDLRHAWRRHVAVAPQDPFLFHDTIAANLRLGRMDATDDALWAALDAVAAGFVRQLPQGLETVVGDRGARLSGGERQRIVLARAWLRRPALLVLDEATASLDGETEAAIARTLAELRGKCTVLVVAHRPSTVQAADHVLLLETGRVVAAGTWDEVRTAAGPRLAALGMMDGG